MNAQRTIRRLAVLPLFLVLQTIFGTGPLPAQNHPFPPASPESQGIAPETIESLHHRIQEWIEEDRIVGAELLVIKNRRTVMHRAFGWNNREREEEMGVNTLFNIRSMTKPLVGTAVQILIQEGALTLDDRVADFLPGFREGEAGKITVELLLTHRSGLPVNLALDPENPSQNLQALADSIGSAGPIFDPGTLFWYSDAGANALGALIETVSGQPLDIFLESRLFGPLGMRSFSSHKQEARTCTWSWIGCCMTCS